MGKVIWEDLFNGALAPPGGGVQALGDTEPVCKSVAWYLHLATTASHLTPCALVFPAGKWG